MGRDLDAENTKAKQQDNDGGGSVAVADGLDKVGGAATGHANAASDRVVKTRRERGVADAVTYAPVPADPEVAQEHKAERDRWRPLTLAGQNAREAFVAVKARAADPDVAIDAGQEGCTQVLAHLAAVQPGPHDDLTRQWFIDAASTTFLLIEAMRDLGAGDLTVVKRLAETLALLEDSAPTNWRGTPKDTDDALERAAGPKDWDASRRQVAPSQLELAEADMSVAIEQFRAQKHGTDPDTKLGGTSENKSPLLTAGALLAAERIDYVVAGLERAEFDNKDPQLIAAVDSCLDEAQRFIYWAMTLDPVEEAANLVAGATSPLAQRFGKPALEVADPIPKLEDRNTLETDHLPDLVGALEKLFTAQREALDDLSDAPAGDGISWNQVLVQSIATLCLTAPLGYVAGAVGAQVAAGIASEVQRAGVSSMVKDLVKGLAGALPGRCPRAPRKMCASNSSSARHWPCSTSSSSRSPASAAGSARRPDARRTGSRWWSS